MDDSFSEKISEKLIASVFWKSILDLISVSVHMNINDEEFIAIPVNGKELK